MKTILVALEHIRADLLKAIAAVERGDVDEAVETLNTVPVRLRDAAEELRAA